MYLVCQSFLIHFFPSFFYFWLHGVFVAVLKLSLVAESGDFSLVELCRLLTAVASLVAEHRLQVSGPQYLQLVGSVSGGAKTQLLCGMGTFPNQGLNSRPLHWQVGSYPQYHLGSPLSLFLVVSFSWLFLPMHFSR